MIIYRRPLRSSEISGQRVVNRANGICEFCEQAAPFIRAGDGTPYLEVHHKIPLAEVGEDTVENAEALCPYCYKEKHYGLIEANT